MANTWFALRIQLLSMWITTSWKNIEQKRNKKHKFQQKICAIWWWHPKLNSLWPSNTWLLRSRSTLAGVMACCLSAPNHYLDQYWLLVNEVLWHSTESMKLVVAMCSLKWPQCGVLCKAGCQQGDHLCLMYGESFIATKASLSPAHYRQPVFGGHRDK